MENVNLEQKDNNNKNDFNEEFLKKQIEQAKKIGINLIEDTKDSKYLKIDSCKDNVYLIDIENVFKNVSITKDAEKVIIKPLNASSNFCIFKYSSSTIWVNNDSSIFLTSVIFNENDESKIEILDQLCSYKNDIFKLSDLIKTKNIRIQKCKSVFLNFLQAKR